MDKTIVFYDQSCRMCIGVTGWLARIDGKRQFQLEPYQNSEYLKEHPELSGSDFEKQIHVVTAHGLLVKGADAIFEIWRKTEHWSSFMAYLLRLPPFIWLARPAYKLVAQFRNQF